MTVGLILAGHGSHISGNTAGLVWDLVDQIRALGVADEVTAGFWKEQPGFHGVIHTLAATDITIVPLFTARGYFTDTVLPAEMGLTGPVTERDGKLLRRARALGEHPALDAIVRVRVEQALHENGIQGENAAAAVIGHGTRRNPASRDAAEAQAHQLRETGLTREAVAVFLDDTPSIPALYDMTTSPIVIAVPYFFADGSHATIDVPRAIGLTRGATRGTIRGRQVLYTAPIGTADGLVDLVLDLARDAGAPLRPARPGSAWDSFPAAGRDLFADYVGQAGEAVFGQLRLTRTRVSVQAESGPSEALTTTAALRGRVRGEPLRPLPYTDDLPGGWHVEITPPATLHAAVETVYPGAIAAWAQAQGESPAVTRLESLIARQTGMFRRLSGLSASQRAQVCDEVCGRCVCQPLWHDATTNKDAIPCLEACNVFLSRAKEILA